MGWWSSCTNLSAELLLFSTLLSAVVKFCRKLLTLCSAMLSSCFSCSFQLQLLLFFPLVKTSVTSMWHVRCRFFFVFWCMLQLWRGLWEFVDKGEDISALTLHEVKLQKDVWEEWVPELRKCFLGALCLLFGVAGLHGFFLWCESSIHPGSALLSLC